MSKLKKTGYLELIMGCMASGKSSELVRRYRRYQQTYSTNQIGLISHATDTRYGEQVICTHDKIEIPCMCVSNLNSMLDDKNFVNWEVIFIEEAQFFPDLVNFVKKAVDIHHKKVIVIGLDGDFERNTFGQILELIPLADDYTKLKAICYYCEDETNAIFTKRLVCSKEQNLVGTLDSYKPVCRYHFFN